MLHLGVFDAPANPTAWRSPVSPILVRPVREQLEHDRIIRLLHAKTKRKNDAGMNPGAERNTCRGIGANRDLPGSGAVFARSRPQARGRSSRSRPASRSITSRRWRSGRTSPECVRRSTFTSLRRWWTSRGVCARTTRSTSTRSGATTPWATRSGSHWCSEAATLPPRPALRPVRQPRLRARRARSRSPPSRSRRPRSPLPRPGGLRRRRLAASRSRPRNQPGP